MKIEVYMIIIQKEPPTKPPKILEEASTPIWTQNSMKKKKSNKENTLKKTTLRANSETQPANCR